MCWRAASQGFGGWGWVSPVFFLKLLIIIIANPATNNQVIVLSIGYRYEPSYLKSIINWQLNSQNSKSMQYKQGSMHSIAHLPSEHQTPNRNHASNSFYAHSNNYPRYPNPSSDPLYQHNNAEEKMHWDQRSEISYHHKNQPYFDKQNTVSRQASSVANQITKVVPMKIRNIGREDYCTNLRVSIFHSERVGPNNPASITINVTDDSNALFLWRFYIPENDFQNFKEQQSLKVDFGGFIGMILETLGYCEDIEKDLQPGSSNNFHGQNHPNFYAVFNIDKNKQKAELKIMQTNKFKESLHMLLHFIKANDEQLKDYLSEKYNKEKNQNLKLSQYISEIENELNRRKLNEEKLGSELKNLERQSSENRYELEKAQKQRLQSFERKAEDKFYKQKKQYLEEHQRIVEDLKLKLEQKKQQYEELLRSHQNANQKTLSLQSTSSSLQNQHILLQTKYDELREEHSRYRSEHDKLNKQHLQLVSKNTKNQYQLASLEEKNEEKNKEISNLKKMQEQIQEQLQYAQGQLKDNRAEIETLRKSLESKGEEIENLQQKIEEWKAKYEKKKKKNNAYMQVIEKQESEIEKHEIDVRKLNSEITLITEHKERLERLVKDKERAVAELQQQIENDKEQIQNQKNMIMQMHKQVNSGRFGANNSLTPSTMVNNNFMTTSSASIKDYSAYTGSESRIKYTGGNIRETSPIGQKSDRQRMMPPPIKKYREPTGIQNEKNRENSRSPIVNKLSQQMDPQEADKTQQKIGPIKFRK